MSIILKLLIALLLVGSGLTAQAAQPIAAPTVQVTPQAAFNVEAATQAYLNSLTPAQKAKSDAYFEGGYWLQLWNVLYALGVAGVFLGLGLSRRLKALVARLPRPALRTLAYLPLYLLLAWVLSFPLTIYEGYFREHQYGLSNQSLGEWLSETLIGLGLTLVFGSLLLLVLYAAVRRTGRNWWVWSTGIVALFLVVSVFLGPVFISPLFNKYVPLPASPIRDGILSMARANGVPAGNVYLVDASKQSKRISANVSGIGSTIRVSLNDNLLNRSTPQEVQAVMGHELGHYVLNHIPKMLVFFVLLIGIGFWFVDWAFRGLVARYGARWDVAGLTDVGGLPLAVALFAVYSFLATPVFNTIIRTNEQEADVFGLNAARQPDAFASVAMKLSEYRKINPGPLEEILFFDHPSGHTRVLTAMRWKAENLGDKQANSLAQLPAAK
ncbi:M48 family metallopeptidase [Hymenobacter arizonensis]|uniref:STE24 endopeptidase n=1 Tax=Hymenobacter arizonensis TaxID=1227077 RepID=A0A1I5XVF1_HYMAR|nr:M48 family metallopeptidase [Hymenobacter arizonensis]SFQ35923.1 STE24 endopeptidase [Hymenobacter arizonensis]